MKKAFTMIELVFVIIVIGILAAVIIPNTRTNPLHEAAIDLISKIRYTQHLATVNDVYDAANPTWFKERWQIEFNTNNSQYSIASNDKFAINPANGDSNLSNIDLSAKYGVNITVNGTECGIEQAANAGVYAIIFDNLGRPLSGDATTLTSNYIGTDIRLVKTNDCNIVLSGGSGETVTISISPETGYAAIAP